MIEVLADSTAETSTEHNVADAAFQLYLDKNGRYPVIMQTVCSLFYYIAYSMLQTLQ